MTVDVWVLILIWMIGFAAFMLFVPKNRRRRFLIAFLICQTFTWLIAVLLVYFDRISYPIREFPKATHLLLALNYFFFPLLCGFYIIYEPKRNYTVRLLYLSGWVTGVVVIIKLLEKYTGLLQYQHYAWYWSWLNFFWMFAVTNLLYRWFFKDKAMFQSDKGATQ
ncbi:CBO0543 family protein [Neobacillus bataviensis]|uniref:CBO0543 family protein n=1 Tax=Neobacillus bataviensis TaxID=220685 RepID=UPI001CBED7FD|nr:CBO0543 family protein [Neobacillus bataviensis]